MESAAAGARGKEPGLILEGQIATLVRYAGVLWTQE